MKHQENDLTNINEQLAQVTEQIAKLLEPVPKQYQLPLQPVQTNSLKISRKVLLDQITDAFGATNSSEFRELLKACLKRCVTCRYWSTTRLESCDLCNQKPPAHIVAFGCPSYKDIEDSENLPF